MFSQVAEIRFRDQFPQARRIFSIEFNQVKLVIGLPDRCGLLEGETKNGAKNHLIGKGMANDENRSRVVLISNGFKSGANTFIELVQRLSSIKLILGIATSTPPFLLRQRVTAVHLLSLELPMVPLV